MGKNFILVTSQLKMTQKPSLFLLSLRSPCLCGSLRQAATASLMRLRLSWIIYFLEIP
jgi:hypothetical protein